MKTQNKKVKMASMVRQRIKKDSGSSQTKHTAGMEVMSSNLKKRLSEQKLKKLFRTASCYVTSILNML